MADPVLRDSLFGLPQQGGAYIRNQVTGELFPSIGQQPGLWPFLSLGGPGTYIDLISNSQLHSAMQFSRASGGATEISQGVLTPAAVNEPRYGWFNGRRGLLIEPATTNLLLQSDNLLSTPWVRRGSASVTADGAGGFMLANIGNADGSEGKNDLFNMATAANRKYTRSLYMRRGTHTGFVFISNGAIDTEGLMRINMALVSTSYERITESHPAVTMMQPNAITPNIGFHIRSNGAGTFFVKSPQIEPDITSSAISTTVSPATRAPDLPTIATAAFGFNPNEGTFVCEYLASAPMGNGILAAALLNLPGNSSDRMTLFGGAGGNVLFEGVQSGVSQFGIGAGLSAANVIQKASCSYADNYFAASSNGLAPNTDILGAVTSPVSTLSIGTAFLPGQLNGLIFNLRYYPRKFTEAELKAASI